MKFGPVPLQEAPGKILAHTLLNVEGHKVLNKGHVLRDSDLEKLQALGIQQVVVVALSSTDLDENEAARRVGESLAVSSVKTNAPGVGRANLRAEVTGVLCINVTALERLNNIDEGITIATLREHSLVQAGDLVALVKIIPFGVQAARVVDVEVTAQEAAPVLSIRPLQSRSVALIVTGPESARQRLMASYGDAVRVRVERLQSRLETQTFVPHEEEAIAAAIQEQYRSGRDLILVAGVSAIIDREDVVPAALRMAGGSVVHFGVPVDPGSLLMLGYMENVPVIGAPGCVKSLKTNVIDYVLPRLVAGERLTRADFVMMGHGGLLEEDISERPAPR